MELVAIVQGTDWETKTIRYTSTGFWGLSRKAVTGKVESGFKEKYADKCDITKDSGDNVRMKG